jgi:hypothetical protein
MYIMCEDIEDLDKLIQRLRERSFTGSIFSCRRENAKGVAVFISTSRPFEYILLSENMCDDDPKYSWTACRKRYENEVAFLSEIDKRLKQ